ncbi:MAG: diguanylate cyclase [Formivibrio sp.]|nr:diguanylate cyclase [Formivibrio sp.]
MFDFRHKNIRCLFIGIVTSMVLSMLAASGYAIWLLQKQKIDSGLNLVSIQARVFEDYLTQSFNNIDVALKNAPVILESGIPAKNAFTLALHNVPYLRSLALIDKNGFVVSSSHPEDVGKKIDTANFLPRMTTPTEVFRIGVPWIGRHLNQGEPTTPEKPAAPDALVFLPVMKIVFIHQQAFTFLATVNTDYFINQFSQLIAPDAGHIELFRLDRTLLFSTDERRHPGIRLDLLPGEHGDTAHPAVFEHTLAGRATLTAYQASRIFPFALHIHLDREVLLAQWQKQMRILLAVIGLSIFAVIGLSVFIYNRLLHTAQIQAATDEQLSLSAQVFKSSAEAIFIATAAMRIFSVNRAFSDITGYSASEVIGQSPAMLYACPEDNESDPKPDWTVVGKNQPWVGEVSHRRKNGEIYPAYLTISCIQDETGTVTHYIGVFSDATERKISARFRFLSEHDFLTGLANRRLLEEHIEQAIARIERHGGRFGVLFLDLDHFKQINDTLGHHIGDLLLKEVAARMQTCVRATDTLCRQGGDEFLLMIDQIDDPAAATHVAEKLISAVSQPYQIEGHLLDITTSIGIALCPEDGLDVTTLTHRADVAMYQAKQHGRNHFAFYHSLMESLS